MDRETILAMKPGRELDSLVENHVFGLPFVDNETLRCPYYSTDISAAWEVVEKFKDNGPVVNMLNNAIFFPDGWHCKLGEDQSYSEKYHVYGCDTAQEAIAKAALLAVLEV